MTQLEHNSDPTPAAVIKKATGFALIVIGVSIGLWVVSVVYDMITSDSMVGLVDVFANQMDKSIQMPAGDIELPTSFFATLGYVVVCILLSICAGVSKAFVQFGAHLVSTDFKALVAKFSTELKSALNERKG